MKLNFSESYLIYNISDSTLSSTLQIHCSFGHFILGLPLITGNVTSSLDMDLYL